MWFQKNKWKIILPVLIVALLAAAFYFGGNAPDSRGWEVGGDEADAMASPDAAQNTPAPENSPEQTPEPTPNPLLSPLRNRLPSPALRPQKLRCPRQARHRSRRRPPPPWKKRTTEF